MEEEREKSIYQKRYLQKFQKLKEKYKPDKNSTEGLPGSLKDYNGVKWSGGCGSNNCANCQSDKNGSGSNRGNGSGCGSGSG